MRRIRPITAVADGKAEDLPCFSQFRVDSLIALEALKTGLFTIFGVGPVDDNDEG